MRKLISAKSLSQAWHLPLPRVIDLCRSGRFKGAYFDSVTWWWWIPYPVVLERSGGPL